jgi:hypothetical protein
MLPRLSKAAVNAKEQEYLRRLSTIEGELADLARSFSNADDMAGDDVDGTSEDATATM